MYDGIINIYKEAGFTSFDVVAKMRGILRQKKIGHTGTLDPAAEGVLPVCVGKGTRLCEMLTDHDKTYRAVMLLGVTTDTQDTTGVTLKTGDPSSLTEEEVRKAILSFVGDYAQIPPMYSALKVNGRKLYELAREGKEIEREARNVTIHEIVIRKMELPLVEMDVSCSKGTYIRTLCHDIGEMLGTGGCMKSLLRTRVGRFSMEDSIRLSELEKLAEEGRIAEVVLPVTEVLAGHREIHADDEVTDRLVRNGNRFPYEKIEDPSDGEGFLVYDSEGNFIGLYEYAEEKELFCPRKIFLGGN